jgi:hypothetical protein
MRRAARFLRDRIVRTRVLLVLASLPWVPVGRAQAGALDEFWPEASLYVSLSPETRLFLNMPYARNFEKDEAALDLAAYIDISLRPIARPWLQQLDWQRSRFIWARVGFDRIVKDEAGVRSVSEDRGVLSLWAKADLPAEVWLEARARADLRWINNEYSTRYRFRLEATREFAVLDHTVVPYANVEWFYDTRYDGWSRTQGQLGSEFTVSPHFRFELYLARLNDRLPTASSINALGVVAKWYY